MKQYVSMMVRYDQQGRLSPVQIQWEDGRVFPIERVLDIRKRACTKAGRTGVRYTVRVQGKPKYLFLEEGRWFVEAKEQEGTQWDGMKK